MSKFDNNAAAYVASVFKKRLSELKMTPYRFINDYSDTINRGTLTRMLYRDGGTNISTIAHYAALLGLEIRIINKETGKIYEPEN